MAGLDAAELARRKTYIVAVGLPCDVLGVVVEAEFAAVVLTPLQGWMHLVPDDQLPAFAALGYTYHVSLGYYVDPELLADIHINWAGVRTVGMIDHVRETNVAMLRWGEGLGSDPGLWAALAQGYPHRVGFGLHISM